MAQADKHSVPIPIHDSAGKADVVVASKYNNDLDLIDVGRNIIHKGVGKRMQTGQIKSPKLRISLVPAVGYTLQTGFAVLLAGNAVFYTDTSANASTILTSFTYTEHNQVILPFQTSIWTKDNKYNIIVDWRYLYFPSYTYGLGGYTSLSNGYLVTYSTVHIHQAILRKIRANIYIGPGYNLDYYWDIRELNPPANTVTDFENYGYEKTEFASGFTFNFLYDTRENPINPSTGNFANVVYRPHFNTF
jgi:hypothetical protein